MYLFITITDMYNGPGWCNSSIFTNLNLLNPKIKISARKDIESLTKKLASADGSIAHPHVFKRVSDFLSMVHMNEVEKGAHPLLKVKNARDKNFIRDRFQAQFRSYAMGHYPFSIPLAEGQSPFHWWTTLQQMPQGDILVVCFLLFSYLSFSLHLDRHWRSSCSQWYRTQWQTSEQRRHSTGSILHNAAGSFCQQ